MITEVIIPRVFYFSKNLFERVLPLRNDLVNSDSIDITVETTLKIGQFALCKEGSGPLGPSPWPVCTHG